MIIAWMLVPLLTLATIVAIWRYARVATLAKVGLTVVVVLLVGFALPLSTAGGSSGSSSVTQVNGGG